jgi:F0F1-type ATP synthase membrane subunit c/vacuolar-type H+-ATPase subunit K
LSVNYENAEGHNAFFLAVMNDHRSSLLLLASVGAEVNSVNDEGLTPLLWALRTWPSNLDLIRTLLSVGASVDALDSQQNGCAHTVAAYAESDEEGLDALRVLTGRNRRLLLGKNAEGKDPAAVARERGLHGLADYLAKTATLQRVPARLLLVLPKLALALIFVCAALGGGLAAFAAALTVGYVGARYGRALNPAQGNCLAQGFLVTFMVTLAVIYLRELRVFQLGPAMLLDAALWLLIPVTVVLMLRVKFRDPNGSGGSTQAMAPLEALKKLLAAERRARETVWGEVQSKLAWEALRGFHKTLCPSCLHQRTDARTQHCSSCNRCVQRHSHHCAFIGACVGSGNHCDLLALLWVSVVALAVWLSLAGRHVAESFTSEPRLLSLLRDELHVLVMAGLASWVLLRVLGLLALQLMLMSPDRRAREAYRRQTDLGLCLQASPIVVVAKHLIGKMMGWARRSGKADDAPKSGSGLPMHLDHLYDSPRKPRSHYDSKGKRVTFAVAEDPVAIVVAPLEGI